MAVILVHFNVLTTHTKQQKNIKTFSVIWVKMAAYSLNLPKSYSFLWGFFFTYFKISSDSSNALSQSQLAVSSRDKLLDVFSDMSETKRIIKLCTFIILWSNNSHSVSTLLELKNVLGFFSYFRDFSRGVIWRWASFFFLFLQTYICIFRLVKDSREKRICFVSWELLFYSL